MIGTDIWFIVIIKQIDWLWVKVLIQNEYNKKVNILN